MSRRVVWLQLLIGWLPVWGLFTIIIVTVHGTGLHGAAFVALRMSVAAAVLGLFVQRLTERLPWPKPVRPLFVLVHIGLAAAYAVSFVALNSVIESVLRGAAVLVVGSGLAPFLGAGVWLYVMIAGVSYTTLATERAANAEANAARARLEAMRAQLQPHFLFNALHAVVQLIPREPARAAQAAEQLAALLRGTIEEDRDLVPASEEWEFVERYLALERLRFGDRLVVHSEISPDAGDVLVPLFAIQTLVENAVRHGAAPRIEPTTIRMSGRVVNGDAIFVVEDTGSGATAAQMTATSGTGLRRLRERLRALYGGEARLDVASGATGFSATLIVPRTQEDA